MTYAAAISIILISGIIAAFITGLLHHKPRKAHALEQLREYTSSPLWNREGRVLSDGIDWKTCRPTANATKGKLIPEDIELQELRANSLQLSTIVYLVLGEFVFVSTTPPSAHCCSVVEVS
jgi:hypothetical protein